MLIVKKIRTSVENLVAESSESWLATGPSLASEPAY
jgi:hypothetical protein